MMDIDTDEDADTERDFPALREVDAEGQVLFEWRELCDSEGDVEVTEVREEDGLSETNGLSEVCALPERALEPVTLIEEVTDGLFVTEKVGNARELLGDTDGVEETENLGVLEGVDEKVPWEDWETERVTDEQGEEEKVKRGDLEVLGQEEEETVISGLGDPEGESRKEPVGKKE